MKIDKMNVELKLRLNDIMSELISTYNDKAMSLFNLFKLNVLIYFNV